MNVVIVAGGNGTRFKSLSVFPKVLLPSESFDSIIANDINIFDGHSMYLIINAKYYDMVDNYLKVNNLSQKIKVFKTSNVNGSYNSIKDCIDRYDDFPRENTLFVWSDLIIKDIPQFSLDKNIIFTFNHKCYRYKFENGSITNVDDYSGNIPGVYYVSSIDNVFNIGLDYFNNFDLVDALKISNIELSQIELESLVEFRDYDTYVNLVKGNADDSLKTRFFNKLEVHGDILTKQAIDEKYYNIIEREYNWYRYGFDHIENFKDIVPKIYSYNSDNHSFEMEYLKDYIPLHKYLKQSKNLSDVKKLYNNIKKTLDLLHKPTSVDRSVFFDDLKKEIVYKVIDRCESIKYMLLNYNMTETTDILLKAFNYLLGIDDGFKVKYVFSHGDINGSNLLVNPNTLEVKLIDPRGYFGNTMLFGWESYEYAKLLYCLYGYDEFNNQVKIYGVDEPKKLLWHDQIDYLNKKEYLVLVGVIFVALAGYISQDIMKANIAYEYGMKLLKQELN